MNLRVAIFSGVMTALVGVVLGIAIAHISGRELRKTIDIIGGASLGFLLGASTSMIMQQRQAHAEEYRDNNHELK